MSQFYACEGQNYDMSEILVAVSFILLIFYICIGIHFDYYTHFMQFSLVHTDHHHRQQRQQQQPTLQALAPYNTILPAVYVCNQSQQAPKTYILD